LIEVVLPAPLGPSRLHNKGGGGEPFTRSDEFLMALLRQGHFNNDADMFHIEAKTIEGS
jgi:hypothetical protein